jgi:DDE_Tnp_1-associated/Inositol monophosphatase family
MLGSSAIDLAWTAEGRLDACIQLGNKPWDTSAGVLIARERAYLATVPDRRAVPGRRHPLLAILGLAAAAVLAGARSIAAIAEWAADAPQPVRVTLGARHHAPGYLAVPAEATIRRALARLDATPSPARSAPGWPTRNVGVPWPAGGGRRRRRQDRAPAT